MDRTALLITLLGALIGLGFLGGLIVGRPWARWITGAVVAAWSVLTHATHPLSLLISVPFIVGMGALGFGAATLGIRVRRGRTAAEEVPRSEP